METSRGDAVLSSSDLERRQILTGPAHEENTRVPTRHEENTRVPTRRVRVHERQPGVRARHGRQQKGRARARRRERRDARGKSRVRERRPVQRRRDDVQHLLEVGEDHLNMWLAA